MIITDCQSAGWDKVAPSFKELHPVCAFLIVIEKYLKQRCWVHVRLSQILMSGSGLDHYNKKCAKQSYMENVWLYAMRLLS